MALPVAADPRIQLLTCPPWQDYQLLDSGDGSKLERFGRYTFVRPEPQAMWQRRLAAQIWSNADSVFNESDAENGGKWQFLRPVEPRWQMQYHDLRFWSQVTSFRHLGVFPEQASQWDWITDKLRGATAPRVLNLFGYTGLATLAAAQAGAQVTHVDASKKVMSWARENQNLSGLGDKPIRWITDDVLKFVRREARRQSHYEGIIMDPPKFGRGTQGELWKFFEMMPELLDECRNLLSDKPLFLVVTTYAVKLSPLALYYALEQRLAKLGGSITAGELLTPEESNKRALSMATYARWSSTPD